MKLSNFRDYVREGTSALDWRFRAKVDVTTGMLWWKKTETKEIMQQYASFWYFVDTGEWTPDRQAEHLSRAYEAQNNLNW